VAGKTIRKIEAENDPRTASERELRAIARACGLPYEFFTVDWAMLGEVPDTEIEDRVSVLEDVMGLVLDALGDVGELPPSHPLAVIAREWGALARSTDPTGKPSEQGPSAGETQAGGGSPPPSGAV
jgi:hypothetical protein